MFQVVVLDNRSAAVTGKLTCGESGSLSPMRLILLQRHTSFPSTGGQEVRGLQTMYAKRKSYNSKRRIEPHPVRAELDRLENKAGYGGKPDHKKNPGDFGLTPPSNPRADKSLCDETGIFTRSRTLKLLRAGIRRGLVSKQRRNGYPQNIWAVTNNGMPVEAQLENPELGTYHGYPIAERDPFREQVLDAWMEET